MINVIVQLRCNAKELGDSIILLRQASPDFIDAAVFEQVKPSKAALLTAKIKV